MEQANSGWWDTTRNLLFSFDSRQDKYFGFRPTLQDFLPFVMSFTIEVFIALKLIQFFELEYAHSFGVGCHVIVLSN